MAQESYLANKYAIIDNLPLFSNLSFFQKRFIASKSHIDEFKKGEIIYRQGDPPNYFYCMVNGRVEIYRPAHEGKKHYEVSIERVRRGDYFGSISSLTGQPHTVSARALNDSVVLKISASARGGCASGAKGTAPAGRRSAFGERNSDFDGILRKVPKLAVFLSRSLPRRLGRKSAKEIFASTIIAVYGFDKRFDSSIYTAALADSLKRESGRKVLVIKSTSISKKNEVSPKLSSYTKNYHYVLVDVLGSPRGIALEILKQSDMRHILSAPDKDSLHKASGLIKILETSFSRHVKQDIFIIVKENDSYSKANYETKTRVLSHDIFATLPKDKPAYRKTIRRIARDISGAMVGLVLSSGAAMGLVHVGVLKVLEEEKIPIDIIAATSMGALIAALWAAGYSSKEIEKLAYSFESKLKTLFLVDPTLPIRGLIKGRAIRRILKPYLEGKTFFDLKVPLKIVACDIRNRKEFIIEKGNLLDAVMASIAIPGVFEPVEYEGAVQLVDGGIVNPAPVSVLSKAGIKRIIVVNALPSQEDIIGKGQKRLNIYDVIVSSFQGMEYALALNSCQQADVYLHPILKFADWFEFFKARQFVKIGRDHARQMLPKMKQLAK